MSSKYLKKGGKQKSSKGIVWKDMLECSFGQNKKKKKQRERETAKGRLNNGHATTSLRENGSKAYQGFAICKNRIAFRSAVPVMKLTLKRQERRKHLIWNVIGLKIKRGIRRSQKCAATGHARQANHSFLNGQREWITTRDSKAVCNRVRLEIKNVCWSCQSWC